MLLGPLRAGVDRLGVGAGAGGERLFQPWVVPYLFLPDSVQELGIGTQ